MAQDARAREQAWAVHMGRLERETLARHVSLQDLVKRISRSIIDKMQQLILQTPPPPVPLPLRSHGEARGGVAEVHAQLPAQV